MKEEWRPIYGYTGFYEVSNLGRVKSLPRRIKRSNGTVQNFKGKIMACGVANRDYPMVVLSKGSGNNRIKVTVHRLVAKAFLKIETGKPEINHKNGIKTDNRVSNIELVSRKENIRHAFNTGLNKPRDVKGSKHPSSKLTEQKVIEMRGLFKAGKSHNEISGMFGVCRQHVADIVNRRKWKHV